MGPSVSVCIPTYNGETYIEEAIESVFSQSYPATEIVVSDDSSVDGTLDIVQRLRENSPIPIRIFHFSSGGRLAANWNHCIRHARGQYIKFLFQDDRLHPSSLEALLSVALLEPAVGMVFGHRYIVTQPENTAHDRWRDTYGDCQRAWTRIDEINEGKDLLRDPALLSPPLNKVGEPSSILFLAETLRQLGGFREDMVQLVDVELYLRLFKHYRVGYLPEVVSDFRLHDAQATVSHRKSATAGREADVLMSMLLGRDFFWLLAPWVRMKLLLGHHWIGAPYRRYCRWRRR